MIICFNFLRNKNYVNKISFRKSTLYKFHKKIYLESFVFIIHICINYLESSTKRFSAAWASHWTTGSSVKPSKSRATLSENAPWVPAILSCSLTCFSFYSVIPTFDVTSCIFALKYFNHSNSVVPLPFLLHHYIR